MASSRSPRYPGVPYSTPASLRPPISNPYDKFSATEFDAWIGDITTKLRRALAREDISPATQKPSKERQEQPRDVSTSGDEAAEDSFAEIKARRAAKGKERAYEIEEDENQGEEEEEESSDVEYDSEAEEEEEYSSQEEQEAGPSASRWEDANGRDEETGSESEESDAEEQIVHEEEVIEILSSSDEEGETPVQKQTEDAEIDEAYDDEEYEGDELRSSPPRAEQDEEDEFEDIPHDESDQPQVDIPDAWEGPATYAEDFYSGGDVPPEALQLGSAHLLPTEAAAEAEGIDLEQELEEDEDGEEFPPRTQSVKEKDVDIPDPWGGPRTFAEDFYAGGELREDASELTPSHLTPQLTPRREEPAPVPTQQPEIIDILDSDEEQEEGEQARARSACTPVEEEDFDESSVQDIYAQLDEDEGKDEQDSGAAESLELPEDVQVPESFERGSDSVSSPLRVPLEKSSANIQSSPSGHVDWRYSPAFPGRVATQPEHLRTSEFEDEGADRTRETEVVEISDEEEEEEVGPVPLGTSDLDFIHHEEEDDTEKAEVNAAAEDVSHSQDMTEIYGPQVEPSIQQKEQEPLPSDNNDIDIYAEFEPMYMLQNEAYATSEPPSTSAAIDFGNLPSRQTVSSANFAQDAQVLELLADIASNAAEMQDVAPEGNQESVPSLEEQIQLAAEEILRAEAQYAEETMGEANDVVESDIAQEMPEVPPSYVVTEALSDMGSEILGSEPMTAVSGDGVPASAEFVVEEPAAQFRQTEEYPSVGHDIIAVDEQPGEADVAVDMPLKTPGEADAIVQEVVQDEEPHGTFTMPEVIPEDEGPSYIVTEARTREASVAVSDAVTDTGNEPAARMDFSVEEVVTEGRRTEEPEWVVTSLIGTPAPELGRTATLYTENTIEHFASHAPSLSYVAGEADSEEERPRHRRPHLVHTPSPSSTRLQKPSADVVSTPSELNVVHEADAEANILKSTNEEISRQAEVEAAEAKEISAAETSANLEVPVDAITSSDEIQSVAQNVPEPPVDPSSHPGTLDSGIPLPVSADPTVPDPASISATPTPASPPAGVQDNQIDNAGSLRERLAATLLKRHTDRGTSGLFTPLMEEDGAMVSSTPESRADAEAKVSVDGAQQQNDQPLVSNGHLADSQDISSNLEPSNGAEQIEGTREDASAGRRTPVKVQDLHHDDADADGDLDPDYVEQLIELSPEEAASAEAAEEVEQRPIGAEEVTEFAQDTPISQPLPERELQNPDSTEPPKPPADNIVAQTGDEAIPGPEQLAETIDTVSPLPEESRPLKRKRRSPTPVALRVTRSMTREPQDTAVPTSQEKGKARAVEESKGSDSSVTDLPSELHDQVTDIQVTHSRGTSRASSLSPTTPDSQASPELTRNASRPFVIVDNVVYHDHNHGRQAQPPAKRPAPPSQPIPQPIPEEPSTAGPSDAVPIPTVSKPVIPSSSPITRSKCRFHKISMPREGDGPRVLFVVPGCSLTNAELMEQEQISDLGDVSSEDAEQVIDWVENLGFSSYLIGILRQLVGVDLLRENEIFYLPQPGDGGIRKRRQRPRASIDGRAIPGLSTSAVHRLGGSNISPRKILSSKADSLSSAGSHKSRSTKRTASRTDSASTYGLSDTEDAPPAKRKRTAAKAKKAPKALEAIQPIAGPSENGETKPRTRRSKRLGVDAAAYKPEEHSPGTSEDDGPAKRTRGKRNATRGVKHDRAAEVEDADRSKAATKKRRVGVRGGST